MGIIRSMYKRDGHLTTSTATPVSLLAAAAHAHLYSSASVLRHDYDRSSASQSADSRLPNYPLAPTGHTAATFAVHSVSPAPYSSNRIPARFLAARTRRARGTTTPSYLLYLSRSDLGLLHLLCPVSAVCTRQSTRSADSPGSREVRRLCRVAPSVVPKWRVWVGGRVGGSQSGVGSCAGE